MKIYIVEYKAGKEVFTSVVTLDKEFAKERANSLLTQIDLVWVSVSVWQDNLMVGWDLRPIALPGIEWLSEVF